MTAPKGVSDVADEPRRLYRSKTDRKFAGVLGGWAAYMGLDPSLVRIAYAVVTILTGFVPGMLLYVLMMFIVPAEQERAPA
jgi:phage shock protein C